MASLLLNTVESLYVVLCVWSVILGGAGSAGVADVFTKHSQGDLCESYVSVRFFVQNLIQCALFASTKRAPSFSYCASESQNCALSLPTYPLGAWKVTQSECSMFSTLMPRPPTVPLSKGSKRFVLASTKTPSGDGGFLQEQNYCVSEGYQFAVISSAAEAQQVADQVGPEIHARCSTYCNAWVYLLPSLHWHDGNLLNKCEVTILNPSSTDDCFVVDWSDVGLKKRPCDFWELPVICETIE